MMDWSLKRKIKSKIGLPYYFYRQSELIWHMESKTSKKHVHLQASIAKLSQDFLPVTQRVCREPTP